MKLLIVSPKFHPVIGGGETYVLNTAKRLHDAGYTVSVAVEPHAARDTGLYPFAVFELEGLSDTNLNIISATSNMHKLLAKLQPDIIHVHGYFALLVTALCNNDIPAIASIHSTPVWGERIIGGMYSFEAELGFARKIVQAACPKLVTAANAVYAEAAKKVVQDVAPVSVVPYPVDLEFFSQLPSTHLRRQFGLDKNDKLILLPSRIIERKGIKEAVFALAKLPENYRLCLPAAFEPLDKAYWANITNNPIYLRVRKRILIPKKKIQYSDMPELCAACDVIAMPSYYEGAPVATVEAMASGKPFVGADSQGINSFINNQVNGVLVPKKSIDELAKALMYAAENPEISSKRAQQAQKDIQYLSWNEQLPQLEQIYKQYASIEAPTTTLRN